MKAPAIERADGGGAILSLPRNVGQFPTCGQLGHATLLDCNTAAYDAVRSKRHGTEVVDHANILLGHIDRAMGVAE